MLPPPLGSRTPNVNPKTRRRSPPIDRGRDPPGFHGLKATKARQIVVAFAGDRGTLNVACVCVSLGEGVPILVETLKSKVLKFEKNPSYM
jgi:hypothetical protein